MTRPPEAAAVPAMPLLTAAVIVHDVPAGRVLLLRRGPGARFAPGTWDLPSGKADRGEPVTAAAVRELLEETGLSVPPTALRLAHVVHGARTAECADGFVTVVFATTTWSGTAVNREPAKHSAVGWTPADSLPAPFVPSSSTALAAYLSSGPPSVTTRGWS